MNTKKLRCNEKCKVLIPYSHDFLTDFRLVYGQDYSITIIQIFEMQKINLSVEVYKQVARNVKYLLVPTN